MRLVVVRWVSALRMAAVAVIDTHIGTTIDGTLEPNDVFESFSDLSHLGSATLLENFR